MNDQTIPYQQILTESIISELYEKCEIDLDEDLVNISSYIGNYALIKWGKKDFIPGYGFRITDEEGSQIIDRKGNFPTIKLSSQLIYKNGKIEKLDNNDKGSYYFSFSFIYQSNQVISGFYHLEITRYSNKRGESSKYLHFVLSPELNVIADFIDERLFPVEYDGYQKCEAYIEREFYFPNSNRDFMIFSQETKVKCESNFFDPEEYNDCIEEINDYDIKEYYRSLYFEDEWDEDEWNVMVESGEYNICNFFDNHDCTEYKENIADYFIKSYGIIDCKIYSEKILLPFTNEEKYVEKIILDRLNLINEFSKYGYVLKNGWGVIGDKYNGLILENRFMPVPRFKGLSLRYMSRYYPNELINMVKREHILIPTKFLSEIISYELYLEICILQESHLDYKNIYNVKDKLISLEKHGLVSMFQNKTIKEIVHIKGGTKYLRQLMLNGKLDIDKTILNKLSNLSIDPIEKKCYDILISVSNDIENCIEQDYSFFKKSLEDYCIDSCNDEFNDLMSDMGAWGNIN